MAKEKESFSGQAQRRKSCIRGLSFAKSERADGKKELTEKNAREATGFAFPTWKKWTVLSVSFTVQMSMNFNTSVYPNAVPLLAEHYQVSEQGARVGQMIFLVAYAFGCELWAPYSEEFGRWPVLQISCFLINIWQLPCALSKNFGMVIVGRFLGGLRQRPCPKDSCIRSDVKAAACATGASSLCRSKDMTLVGSMETERHSCPRHRLGLKVRCSQGPHHWGWIGLAVYGLGGRQS